MTKVITEGIYFNLPEAEYHAAPGISNSMLKDLYISPLDFWDRHINPEPPERKSTAAQEFGTALHCRILEPDRFAAEYARKICKEEYPDALDTMDDLREHCKALGIKATTTKAATADRIREVEPDIQILHEIIEHHAAEHDGKKMLSPKDYDNIQQIAGVAFADEYFNLIYKDGFSEVSIFVKRGDVMFKCRIDRLTYRASLDLKSFSAVRGRPIDREIKDALYYEDYWIQAHFYQTVRELARQKMVEGKMPVHDAPDNWDDKAFIKADDSSFGLIFLQSSRPYHMQIWALKRMLPGQTDENLYWHNAEMRIEYLMALHQEHVEKYGNAEWRETAKPRLLDDMDMPQLIYS